MLLVCGRQLEYPVKTGGERANSTQKDQEPSCQEAAELTTKATILEESCKLVYADSGKHIMRTAFALASVRLKREMLTINTIT